MSILSVYLEYTAVRVITVYRMTQLVINAANSGMLGCM
jgi:hypothetical protein